MDELDAWQIALEEYMRNYPRWSLLKRWGGKTWSDDHAVNILETAWKKFRYFGPVEIATVAGEYYKNLTR